MVTASLVHEHAQNMNYAVKFQLLSALLTSAGISLDNTQNQASSAPKKATLAVLTRSSVASALPQPSTLPLTTPQLSKQSRSALWLVGCEG